MQQVFVVVSADWEATEGHLFRFTSEKGFSQDAIDVSLGKKGMGIGRGLISLADPGPVKKEGDLRSPAGVFSLGTAFGLNAFVGKYPYIQLHSQIVAVDDPDSVYYNQLVDQNKIGRPDWKTGERMSEESLYEWGVVIEHNYPKVKKGYGSAIFFHVWRGKGHPTFGCTAMESCYMKALLEVLDAPILIQLPRPLLKEQYLLDFLPATAIKEFQDLLGAQGYLWV